jgi:hypothetical protein
MSRKDDEQDRSDEENVEVKLGIKRRDFLKTLALAGGSAVAAFAVQACAAGKPFKGVVPARAFDIALPASYSINEPALVLDVTLSDGGKAALAFAASGSVRLDPTSQPQVAALSLAALKLSSSSNPLSGHDTGVITAQVPARTEIGTLNLETGRLAEHPFPIVVSFERNHSPVTTTVQPLAAQVSERPGGSGAKCTKENDVEVPMPQSATLPGSRSRGTLHLGLTPRLSEGGTRPT